MRVSQRGLYALQALLHLAERFGSGLAKAHEIAEREKIPPKFLEAILVTLKHARLVASARGRDGGYRLRRSPAEILVGEVVRLMDGPLAPFGDAAELRERVASEPRHAGLFELFLEVRDAAAAILDNTTLADLLVRDQRVLQGRRSPVERTAHPPAQERRR